MASLEDEVESLTLEDISIDDQPFEIQWHPSRPHLTAALINGHVQMYNIHEEEEKAHDLLFDIAAHSKSCRTLDFSHNGAYLYTGSSDKSMCVIDIETQKIVNQLKDLHQHPINVVAHLDQNLLCSGDDDGFLNIHDVRIRNNPKASVHRFEESGDFISGIVGVPEKHMVLTSSGDGYLNVFDLRGKGEPFASSEGSDDEFLSIALIKNGKRILCGSREGSIYIWKWGEFGVPMDKLVGHPKSIDTIQMIDPDTIVTGSSDGLIRLVQIHPNKLLGVVGGHDFPVECVSLSGLEATNRRLLASSSHDLSIKIWDVQYMYDDSDPGECEPEEEEEEEEEDNDEGSKTQTEGGAECKTNEEEDDDDDEAGDLPSETEEALKGSESESEDFDDSDDSDSDKPEKPAASTNATVPSESSSSSSTITTSTTNSTQSSKGTKRKAPILNSAKVWKQEDSEDEDDSDDSDNDSAPKKKKQKGSNKTGMRSKQKSSFFSGL